MGYRYLFVSLVFAIGYCAELSHGQEPGGESANREIRAAIRELAHRNFIHRERATDFLWRRGIEARSQLEQAVTSEDREVAYRAQQILERFRFGIFPDTPKEITDLVNQFRFGNSFRKRDALSQLQKREDHRRVATLLDTVENSDRRLSLARTVLRNYDQLVAKWLVNNRDGMADEMMRWSLTVDDRDSRVRDFAAYLYLSGKDSNEILRLEKLGDDRKPSESLLLIELYRIAGRLERARELAEQSGDELLVTDILMRLGDYESLKDIQYIAGKKSRLEQLGFSLVLHRFAGDFAAMDEIAKEIKAIGSDPSVARSSVSWQASEALMIAGRWNDAIETQQTHGSHLAFVLLSEQLRLDEAFRYAGIDDPCHQSADWFAERASNLEFASTEMKAHIEFGLEVARTLHRIGEKNEMFELLAAIERVANDRSRDGMMLLFVTEHQLGLHDLALKHAAETLASTKKTSLVFTELFGESATALVWWSFFLKTHHAESRLERLQRIHKLLKPDSPFEANKVLQLARQAEQEAAGLAKSTRTRWLKAIGEMCVTHGQEDLAHEYFGMLSRTSPANLQRIGDLWRNRQQWSKASHWYQLAWQADESSKNVISLYLQGYCLKRQGRVAEAKRLLELADLIPRGDSIRRNYLADGLQKRGLKAEALEQWQRIIQFGTHDYRDYKKYMKDAARYAGEFLNASDRLQSAEHMQRRVLYHLFARLNFKDPRSYPSYLHRIHRTRAVGLIAAGQLDQGIEQMWRAYEASPGEAYIPILVVPELESAGKMDVADEIFDRVYRNIRKCVDRYPQSAYYSNRIALLAARCNRRLEQSLVDAQLANKLEPDQPHYLLTLAEVHFRMGDLQRAISLARKSAELRPDSSYYSDQLQRYQKARSTADTGSLSE